MDADALALARSSLGVGDLVAHLIQQDPLAALLATADMLARVGDSELRQIASRTAALREIVDGASEDDLVNIDLDLRRRALDDARAQVWRIWLETAREIGSRIGSTPEPRPGRPRAGEAVRAATARTFGLSQHIAKQYVALAQLDPMIFDTTRERGLSVVTRGKLPSISTLLRGAAASGELEGDEWSTPPWLLEPLRAALGGQWGVDVASHLAAQACMVRALRWYSASDPVFGPREQAWAERFGVKQAEFKRAIKTHGGVDSLADDRPWYLAECPTLIGNPPYSRELVRRFHEKLQAVRAEHPDLAWTWIVNLDPSKEAQQELGRDALHVQVGRRVSFLGIDGAPARGNAYSTIVFAGGPIDRSRFATELGPVGNVYQLASAGVSIAHVRDLARAQGRGDIVRDLVDLVTS